MIITLCDLPFELLLQVAQHLSFSDLWYFSTCSKQTKTLGYELILNKYDINLIRPKIINPFANLVHSAVAYLERHRQQPTTIQSVANHLTVAINDRIPLDAGMSATLDFLLDKCLSILIDSIFLDIPYLSSSELKQWDKLRISFSDLPDDHQQNESTINNNNNMNTSNNNFNDISNNSNNNNSDYSINGHGDNDDNPSDNHHHSNDNNHNHNEYINNHNDNSNNNSDATNTSSNDTTLLYSRNVSSTNSITSSINTAITSATFRMTEFITTLNEMLSVFYTDVPFKKLLMPQIHRVLIQLTNRRRKPYQQDMAKYGLRICVLFLCCLFQHDLVTGADIISFAHELPQFFTAQPGHIDFIQQRKQQQKNKYDDHDHDGDYNKNLSDSSHNYETIMSPGPTLSALCYDTELRMFILMDLVRIIINHYRSSGQMEALEIKCLISMLQNSLSAFKSIKIVNT